MKKTIVVLLVLLSFSVNIKTLVRTKEQNPDGFVLSNNSIMRDDGAYLLELKSDVTEGKNRIIIEDRIDGAKFILSPYGIEFTEGHCYPYNSIGVTTDGIYNSGGMNISGDDYVSLIAGSEGNIYIKFDNIVSCIIKSDGIYKSNGIDRILDF